MPYIHICMHVNNVIICFSVEFGFFVQFALLCLVVFLINMSSNPSPKEKKLNLKGLKSNWLWESLFPSSVLFKEFSSQILHKTLSYLEIINCISISIKIQQLNLKISFLVSPSQNILNIFYYCILNSSYACSLLYSYFLVCLIFNTKTKIKYFMDSVIFDFFLKYFYVFIIIFIVLCKL